ncbi:hypothetical protein [Halomonas nitroreducens]|uniref:Uncharacterized protein n=1 Tax=Halomonas nitroreducens TaxID=447425 RepID=A0A3S0J6M3_9GAMM|nr:hypothetical protein [Halomonas nitroreducens]RTQ97922.1 hypothetical protein EKG36_19615 [Halomonas nitroreducens]
MDLEQQIELIRQSPLFDAEWYLATYPDVARLDMCPATHFARYGWRVGRNPSAAFHTRGYQEQHGDVARSGANPLIHYLQHGEREGRRVPAVSRPVTPLPAARSTGHPAGSALRPGPVSVASPPAPPTSERPEEASRCQSLQLEHTQQLLEHYFRRCQELEYQLMDAAAR